LQQFLLQAVHPTSSQLLQLPHVSAELVAQAQKQGVATVKEFGRLPVGDVAKLLDGYSDGDKREVVEIAKHWPVVDFVDAKFQGEHSVPFA